MKLRIEIKIVCDPKINLSFLSYPMQNPMLNLMIYSWRGKSILQIFVTQNIFVFGILEV